MRLDRRRLWRPLLGLGLGVLLLGLAARGIELQELWRGMQRAHPLWVGTALLTVLLTTAAKVFRWRGLLPGARTVAYPSVARALVVGQLVNALLPARLGEVARFYVLGRDEGVSKATVLGTIATEKTFDVLFLVITAGLAAAFTSLPEWLHGSLYGVVGVGAAVLAAAVALPQRSILGVARRLTSCLPEGLAARLTALLERGLIGLEALRRPRLAMTACAWSTLIWALGAGTNLVLFWAFGISLSVGAALLLLTLLYVGMTPPSSPGRLGVFHAVTVVGLGAFGIERATGLAYATVLHAVVYGPQLVLGALALGLPGRHEEVAW